MISIEILICCGSDVCLVAKRVHIKKKMLGKSKVFFDHNEQVIKTGEKKREWKVLGTSETLS